MKRTGGLAVVAMLVLASVGTVAVAGAEPVLAQQQQDDGQFVRGEPDVDGYLAQPTVEPGTETEIQIDLVNSGEMETGGAVDERVTTARGASVTVEAEDDSPLEVTSDETAVGNLQPGAMRSVPISIRVPESVEPGEYDLDVEVEYRHTRTIYSDGDVIERSRSDSFDVTVVVDSGARFAIVEADTDAEVGGDGEVAVTLQNVGDETATEARVTGETPSANVVIGQQGERGEGGGDEAFVGEWAPGENRTVTFDSTITESYAGDPYVLETVVAYSDEDGIDRQSAPARTGVVPLARPSFSVVEAETDAAAGGDGEVTVTMRNDGERTIDSASVTATTPTAGVTIGQGGDEAFVGEWAPGEERTVTLDATVEPGYPGGQFLLEASVVYRDATGDERRSVPSRVGIEPLDRPTFTVVETATDAQVGGDGDVELTLRSEADRTIEDVSVTATTPSGSVVIGEGGQDDAFVGEWAPGEERTLTFDSTVTDRFPGGSYTLEATVTYFEDGEQRQAPRIQAGVEPMAEQEFAIEGVEGNLEVGYAGGVEGTLTNDGPTAVDEAVLRIEPQSDRIEIDERQFALPELEPGESAEFRFDAEVSGQADPGPRQVRFVVEHDDGTVEETDRIEVAPRQPEFDVAIENATVPAGGERQLRVTLTNNRPETLSSINVGMYADSPLTEVDDEAFVDELESGESAEVLLTVGAESGATQKTHPIELDFRYDDADGEDRISDVYQQPVEVTEPESSDDGGVPWLVVGLVAVVVIAAGGWWYRNRR